MLRNRAFRPRSSALRAAVLLAAVAVAPLAAPQFFGNEKPWAALKLNPKTRVKLAFRNSNVDAVIAWYQNATGVTIIKDPTLTGPITLSSAKAVPLDDALQILQKTLDLKGYSMNKSDNFLVIKKRDQNRGSTPTIDLSPQPTGNGGGFDENQAILQVYPVTNASASQIARIINSVFANSGSQNFGGFRFGENQGTVDIEASLQGAQRFGGGGGGGGGQQGRGGGGGFGGQQGRGGFNFRGIGQQSTLVSADYDDYSNQVIVSAPQRFQSQVKTLINQLDKLTETPTQTKVYHLDFATATEAVATVQQVLNANVPRGKGGATTAQQQGPGSFFNALRGQTTGSGTVTADVRTNNIVVTATPENIKIVDQIIKELDQNIPVESTTFVFPLNNAKADEVATLLQSAFGTRTGVSGGRTGGQTTAGRQSTTGNRTNSQGNRNTGQRLGAEVQGNDLALDVNPDGELATSVGVTQNFGQGFFNQGGQGRTGTNQRTLGVGANGQVVNTRDLSNQVTAIADTNTNSLIVVTSPENAAIIKAILDQLDKIPEQVLIETIIVEATLTSSDKLGVEWSYTGGGTNRSNVVTDYNNVGATASTTNDNQGFRYTLTGTNYSVFVNALKSDSKFQVLSTPKIFTSNGVEAEINISQSLPYITSNIQNVNGTFTNNYQFTDVGIVLTVTPRITSNGMVAMDVEQTANDLQGYTSFNAPIINQRIANTRVSVKDGETIILGGIIRNAVTTDVRKIPILGDIPLLGQVFRSTVKSKEKTELLVFLTPHVVRDSDEARRLRQDQERQLSPDTNRSLNDHARTGNNEKSKTPERTLPPATNPGGGPNPPANGPGGNPR